MVVFEKKSGKIFQKTSDFVILNLQNSLNLKAYDW